MRGRERRREDEEGVVGERGGRRGRMRGGEGGREEG